MIIMPAGHNGHFYTIIIPSLDVMGIPNTSYSLFLSSILGMSEKRGYFLIVAYALSDIM